MASTYEPIATTTLGSASNAITFTSISSAYTDLKVVFTGTASTTTGPLVYFNNDSGSNFSRTYLYANGSSAASGSTTSAQYINVGNWYTSNPCFTTIDIFSYAGSTYKTCLVNTSSDQNGSGVVYRIVGLWRSTSAINRIDLYMASDQFNAGTTATIWGIKAA